MLAIIILVIIIFFFSSQILVESRSSTKEGKTSFEFRRKFKIFEYSKITRILIKFNVSFNARQIHISPRQSLSKFGQVQSVLQTETWKKESRGRINPRRWKGRGNADINTDDESCFL